jgi:hypothetical protein
VGDSYGVETGDAAVPQIGRDDVLSEVEFGATRTDGSSSVDQQSAALRRDEENRVALADMIEVISRTRG